MTTSQFNNLSNLCTAFFSVGRVQLYTCYYLIISSKTHINPISFVQNQGIIGAKYFVTLGKIDRV